MTQRHSDIGLQVSSFLDCSLSRAGAISHHVLVLHKAKHDHSGRMSLCAIAAQMVCNNDYYFWNIVKTSIRALKLFTLNVRKVYAVISLSESEQEQCPDYRKSDEATGNEVLTSTA